jgi:hypothetical protein
VLVDQIETGYPYRHVCVRSVSSHGSPFPSLESYTVLSAKTAAWTFPENPENDPFENDLGKIFLLPVSFMAWFWNGLIAWFALTSK